MPTLRVFNRGQYKYWLLAEGEIELPSGVWTEVPEELAFRHLLADPDLLIDWGQPKDNAIFLPLPHLTFATQINVVTGYGNMAHALIPLMAHRFHLQLFPLAFWVREGVAPEVARLMDQPARVYTKWALALTLPTELKHVPSPNIVLFSMWETGELPEGWAELVNAHAKHLVVPCRHQARLWREAGVECPISTVPLGVDTTRWAYRERPPRPPGTPFTILLYGLLTSRKSPIETIADVCWQAFHDVDDWLLILKTYHGQLGGGAFTPIIKDPHVRVINTMYTTEQMVELCYQADCGIFLSKFEGWGLPPREMMATGLPVIWSAWSGHLEDCGKGIAYDIPMADEVPAIEAYAGLGGWGLPDWDRAAQVLRAEYENWHRRGRTQSPLGTKAAQYIQSYRTWHHTAARLEQVIYSAAEQHGD